MSASPVRLNHAVLDVAMQKVLTDRNANVVVLGDLNDFDFSAPIDTLTSTGHLVDLPRTLPIQDRYTYVFEGNSEVLDHILLSHSHLDHILSVPLLADSVIRLRQGPGGLEELRLDELVARLSPGAA